MDAWAKSQRRPLPGSGIFSNNNNDNAPSSTTDENGNSKQQQQQQQQQKRKEQSNINNNSHQKQLQLHPQQQLTSSQRLTQHQLPLGAAAQRAHRIHTSLVNTYKSTHDPHLAPSTISYNAAINAWSKSYHPSAGEMAELLLGEMMREWRFGNDYLGGEDEEEDDDGGERDGISVEGGENNKSKRKRKRRGRGNERVKPDVVTFTAV